MGIDGRGWHPVQNDRANDNGNTAFKDQEKAFQRIRVNLTFGFAFADLGQQWFWCRRRASGTPKSTFTAPRNTRLADLNWQAESRSKLRLKLSLK
jgi:hypothetical protein